MPTVLFLGASVSQLAAIRQAREAGWYVVAVDGDPSAVAFDVADAAEAVDFTDLERVVDIGQRYAIDAIVAISSDRAVPIAAAVAEQLGLPGIGSETARRMTDKAAMRIHLQEHGVPQPQFAVVSDVDGALRELDSVGLPAVLKPVDSGGQRGICKINSIHELAERLPQTLAHSTSKRAILERHVDGSELNAIVVVRRGVPELVTLSDRLRPPGRGFGVGWIHLFPSQLASAALATAEAVALAAVRALGLQDGIAFPQLLVSGENDVIQLWDVAGGKATTTLTDKAMDWTFALAFSADGKQLVSGDSLGVVRLWDVAGAKKVADLPAKPTPAPKTPPEPVATTCLAFAPDGKSIVLGTAEGPVSPAAWLFP